MRKFDYTEFRGEVKKQMVIQAIPDYMTLAQMAGRSHRTIGAFMCGVRNSARTAMQLKNALKIKHNYGFECNENKHGVEEITPETEMIK